MTAQGRTAAREVAEISNKIYGKDPMHFSNEIAQIKEIGLNGAIAIQIIHYWISQYKQQEKEQNFRDGRYWHYSTYNELHEKYFLFIAEVKTVKSVFLRLEHLGVLLSEAYGAGRKKWYTIDYDKLDRLIADNDSWEHTTGKG